MNDETTGEQRTVVAARRAVALWAAAIVAVGVAAYWNSFSGAFVYDDLPAIVDNPAVHHLRPLAKVLMPKGDGLPVAGRPLVNLSLAINYAWSGTNPWSYHAVNLAIHLGAALALFGCVRRTLLQPILRERMGRDSTAVAAAIAFLWIVHPLQTESVTYIVQRAESLMGGFYLLTLYAFIRAIQSAKPARWHVAAVAACACGMASKEVMVSAPLMLLLYDRTFAAGSFRAALKIRGAWYAALAASWGLLVVSVMQAGSRGGTAGFESVAWWTYAQAQFGAIVHYLRLALWPHPLVFDYGVETTGDAASFFLPATMVALLVFGTAVALWRRPVWGFLGTWFFAILAPTSSVVPIVTETIAEHRMYLPLAAIVALAVLGLRATLGRWSPAAVALLVLGSGALTANRNRDYRSELVLWSDTTAKRPENARAHFNLGVALFNVEKIPDAIREYEAALKIRPNFARAHSNLGTALLQQGKFSEATEQSEMALQIAPTLAEAHANLGDALFRQGRVAEALGRYREAVRLKPGDAEMQHNLGTALAESNRLPEAVEAYRTALALSPADAALVHFHLGNAFARMGQFDGAITEYEQALQARSDYPMARDNLARVRLLREKVLQK